MKCNGNHRWLSKREFADKMNMGGMAGHGVPQVTRWLNIRIPETSCPQYINPEHVKPIDGGRILYCEACGLPEFVNKKDKKLFSAVGAAA